MDKTEEILVKKFLRTIKNKPNNTKKLFAIGMIGITGSGKSFVANELSKILNLYIGSNDKIRRFLNENGMAGASPAQDLVNIIAPLSSRYLYENKISHIIDADLVEWGHIARKNAEDSGALFFMIKIVCPEKIILERVEKREREIKEGIGDNLSRVGQAEYFIRKKKHQSLPSQDVFFTIDTSGDVDLQIEKLIDKLKEEKVI